MLDFTTNESWTFDVISEPVFDARGNQIPNRQNIIRTDTGESLGCHGKKYKITTHSKSVNAVMDAIKLKENELGTNYNLTVNTYDNGKRIMFRVDFPDHYIDDPEVGDIIGFGVEGLNSYDGTFAFHQDARAQRYICKNGMISGVSVSSTRAKHTSAINLEASAEKISTGLSTFVNSRDIWESYRKIHVNSYVAEQFLKRNLCKRVTKTSDFHYNKKQLEALMNEFFSECTLLGANKWSLYNTMTHWASHPESKSPDRESVKRVGMVAKAMRSQDWKAIV